MNRPDLSDIWGWNKGMPWGWHTVLQSQVNKGIQIFFESTPKSDEPAVISQSRVMYESCMNAGMCISLLNNKTLNYNQNY